MELELLSLCNSVHSRARILSRLGLLCFKSYVSILASLREEKLHQVSMEFPFHTQPIALLKYQHVSVLGDTV